jgi:HEAT repeat protein
MHAGPPNTAIEAIYAFGALAIDLGGNVRRQLLLASGPELTAFVAAGRPEIRLAALRVIGRVFPPRAGELPVSESLGDPVVAALNDPDKAIRAAATDTLGSLRYERAVQALMDHYQHYGTGADADRTLDALAHIGHRSSLNFMTAALTTRVPTLRRIAIEGLARIGDHAHAGTVQGALAGERNEAVLLAGHFAVARLSGGSLDAIARSLTDKGRREQAFNYLIELAPGRTGDFAVFAKNPDARVRADVADILAIAADPAALAVVEPMTRDADPQVVRAAERAVVRLRAVSRPTS